MSRPSHDRIPPSGRELVKQCALVAAAFVAFEVIYALTIGQLDFQHANLIQHIPLKDAVADQWSDGVVPTWTSLVGAGQPVYSDSATLPLDPRNLLFAPFGTIDGYIIAGILTRAFAAAIVFAYLRRCVGASGWAAFIGASVFLSGTVLFEEGTALSIGSVFLPGFIWLSERLYDELSVRRFLALAGAWALFIVTNSAAYAPYIALGCAVWIVLLALFREGRPDRGALTRFLIAFGASGVVGLALVAVVVLPSAELGSLSNRGGEYPTDPYAADSLRALFFGVNERTATDLPYLSTGFFYVGIIALVPILVALRGSRGNPYVRAGITMAAGAVVLLTLVFLTKPTLIDVLPTLASVPLFRPSILVGFGAAVVVTVGMDQADWRLPTWGRLAIGVLLLLQAAILVRFAADGTAFLAVPLALVALRAFGLGGAIWLTGEGSELRAGRHRLRPSVVVGALIAVELAAAWGIARVRTGFPYEKTEEVRYLEDATGPNLRAMEILARPEWPEPPGPPDPLAGTTISYALVQNAPAFMEIPTANVYAGIISEHYSETFKDFGDFGYRQEFIGRAPNASMTTTRYDSPLVRALGVGYLYSTKRFPTPDLRPVVTGDGYYVYEVEDPLPRAYFAGRARWLPEDEVHEELRALSNDDDGAVDLGREILIEGEPRTEGRPAYAPADVTEDRGSSVEVEVDAPRDGFLVLSDVDLPGWTAEVDGTETEIERANGFARAVRVPAGAHTVRFSYVPQGLKAGAAISIATAFLCLTALAADRFRRRRRDTMEDHEPRTPAS